LGFEKVILNLMTSLRRVLAAMAAGALAVMAHGAAAQGGVQIDTSVFSLSSPPQLCTLGQSCSFAQNLHFNITLGNGTTFNTVYIYREGVIGLGAALPTTATFGSLASLGGAYIAPAFADFAGENVHVTFGLSGGTDHGLALGVNDDVLIDWYVEPTTPDPTSPTNDRGEFQIKFHTAQYGTGGPSGFSVNYGGNLGDPNVGAEGLYWPGSGSPSDAVGGTRSVCDFRF
jgi:hypothetical protein